MVEFSPREMASRIYDKVSEKVSSIDVSQVRDSVRGSLQNASSKMSSYWQELQVLKDNTSFTDCRGVEQI